MAPESDPKTAWQKMLAGNSKGQAMNVLWSTGTLGGVLLATRGSQRPCHDTQCEMQRVPMSLPHSTSNRSDTLHLNHTAHLRFEPSNFELVSRFDIRISNFPATGWHESSNQLKTQGLQLRPNQDNRRTSTHDQSKQKQSVSPHP